MKCGFDHLTAAIERKCLHGYGVKQGPCPICDAPNDDMRSVDIAGNPDGEDDQAYFEAHGMGD